MMTDCEGHLAQPGATMNYSERPYIVIWEMTQACDLACVHCRACAKPLRHPLELTTAEAENLIDQVADLHVPVFVLSGGDPLRRPDLFTLVEYATMRGVRTSLTPSATPLLTQEAIAELQSCGLARLAVSLDGSTAEIHDAFRGIAGSYELTLQAVRWARELGVPVQINTTITRRNIEDFDAMVRLLESLDIVLWSVFFLVPTGRGQVDDLISGGETEEVFAKLYETSRRVKFDIKTTEAPHYRRYVAQAQARERRLGFLLPFRKKTEDGIGRAPRGINDAKGFVFISHLGDVFPSGFLPLPGGNIRRKSLADIYRHSPLFRDLRDTSLLEGKCRACEFREICGGSRARAFALTGNPLAQEPCCIYQPKAVSVAA